MNVKQKSYLSLNLAVFLFGFTGILGHLIDLSALALVWWRALITWIGLIPILIYFKEFSLPKKKNFKIFFIIGILVAIHWICFYGSIKLSNSSVAMICLAFIPIFTAISETLLNKKAWNKIDLIVGLAIIPGMVLIVQNISTQYKIGFAVGILAAIFSAIFATLNKKHIHEASPMVITWIELFSVWVFISFIMPIYYSYESGIKFWPSASDWFYLLILAILCTIIAFVLTVKSLQHLSAFSAMLCFNLEPVYGIVFAAIFLHDYEHLNSSFYIGVVLIVCTLIIYPYISKSKLVNQPIN
jgi:drug/metabolite transporter (DMT)-like permease